MALPERDPERGWLPRMGQVQKVTPRALPNLQGWEQRASRFLGQEHLMQAGTQAEQGLSRVLPWKWLPEQVS